MLTAPTCQSLKVIPVIPVYNFIPSQTLNTAKSLRTPHVSADDGKKQATGSSHVGESTMGPGVLTRGTGTL